MTPEAKVKERFMSKVRRTSGCWLWTAGVSSRRYGEFFINPRRLSAHRAAWELFVGDIPTGMFVCHRCDVTRCVRPDHLFLGTALDNATDRAAKGRSGRRADGRYPPGVRKFSDVYRSRPFMAAVWYRKHLHYLGFYKTAKQAAAAAASFRKIVHRVPPSTRLPS